MRELHPYYERELAYFRESAGDFARAYPDEAGRLDLERHRCEDPHVERLIEAFCLIAGRIHHRLDSDMHEVVQSLVSMVYPSYTRPIPSTTILQFRLDPAQTDSTINSASLQIPRGHQVAISDDCEFRTVYPLSLWPVEVESACVVDRADLPVWGMDASHSGGILLRLRTAAPGGFSSFAALDSLRFCLRGSTNQPFVLYEYLFNYCTKVIFSSPSTPANTLTLDPGCLAAVGFDNAETLTGSQSEPYHAFRLLQDYLALPEKFLFFDLNQMERATGYLGTAATAEVLFALDSRCPKDDRFRRLTFATTLDSFQLGCTPAVNLLERAAEPIRLDHFRAEHRIEPDLYHPERYEIFSVKDVRGIGIGSRRSRRYEPLFTSARPAAARQQSPGFWHAVRRQSSKSDDDGTEVFLSVSHPDREEVLSDETLAVDITCTNRDLPSSFEFTFQFTGVPGGDNRVQYRMLQRPTRTMRPPLDHRLDWRLVSHLGLNYVGLTANDSDAGAAALRELLTLHDFSTNDAVRNRISSIAHASATPSRARVSFKRGEEVVPVFCHGLAINLNLTEHLLSSTGAFLLSAVLERFFAAYCSLNSFTELTTTTDKERRILKRWPPRAGTQTLM